VPFKSFYCATFLTKKLAVNFHINHTNGNEEFSAVKFKIYRVSAFVIALYKYRFTITYLLTYSSQTYHKFDCTGVHTKHL